MNDKQDAYSYEEDPSNLGSDADVPVVHIPPPEHPHHPPEESHHRHHYLKHSVEFVRKHCPTRNTWIAAATVVSAISTFFTMVIYFQIRGIMESSSGQTDKLIQAANTQAIAAQNISTASDRNAVAAEQFSRSADQIREQTEKAVRELNRAAKDSENAITQGSANAQRALNASINATLLDQRAWVGAAARLTRFDSKGIEAKIVLQNTGKTPAIDVMTGYSGFVTLPDEEDGYGCDFISKRTIAGPIPPQIPVIVPQIADSDSGVVKNYQAIYEGKKFLYIYGCVIYWDIRGPIDTQTQQAIQPHTTSFCFVYDKDIKDIGLCKRGNFMN